MLVPWEAPVPLGWPVSPTPPASPCKLAGAHNGKSCFSPPEEPASSAVSQLAGAEQDVLERASAVKKGVSESILPQFLAEEKSKI